MLVTSSSGKSVFAMLGPFATSQVAEQKGLTLSDDRGVTGGDVEIALRVEARVRKGMPAQPDVGLTKHLDLAGASAGQEPKLGFHGLRTKRYK